MKIFLSRTIIYFFISFFLFGVRITVAAEKGECTPDYNKMMEACGAKNNNECQQGVEKFCKWLVVCVLDLDNNKATANTYCDNKKSLGQTECQKYGYCIWKIILPTPEEQAVMDAAKAKAQEEADKKEYEQKQAELNAKKEKEDKQKEDEMKKKSEESKKKSTEQNKYEETQIAEQKTKTEAEVKSVFNALNTTNLGTLLGRIINGAMGILGSIALVMFTYGGILWMTAAGDAQKSEKARAVVVWSTLGLAVIFASYAILKFVFEAFK